MFLFKVLLFLLCISSIAIPQTGWSFNVDGRFSGNAASNAIKGFEANRQLARDSQGRKQIISPGSKIDNVDVQMAPHSTVILNIRQFNRGAQINNTPYRYNTEIMEE